MKSKFIALMASVVGIAGILSAQQVPFYDPIGTKRIILDHRLAAAERPPALASRPAMEPGGSLLQLRLMSSVYFPAVVLPGRG